MFLSSGNYNLLLLFVYITLSKAYYLPCDKPATSLQLFEDSDYAFLEFSNQAALSENFMSVGKATSGALN